jgi:anaerobic ribonucleoside-triphosphate reductase activating protein
MPALTLILDDRSGDLLLEGPDRLPADALAEVTALLGPGREVGCARPRAVLALPAATPEEVARASCLRIAGLYHHSLIEGPGRRSAVLCQACPLACRGCWVPHLHDPAGGWLAPVDRLADALLDPAEPRDGVSILGGEPFAQPDGLLALVQALRARGCPHILCYSGYTYAQLRRRARRQPAVGAVLDTLDMLIDGPYVEALAGGAGPWTGSGNQRVLTLTAGTPTPYRPE